MINYPSWLDFKEPYKEDDFWICPYCKEKFDIKEKAYPKLVMTWTGYQKLYI